jgi:hypothetical protein
VSAEFLRDNVSEDIVIAAKHKHRSKVSSALLCTVLALAASSTRAGDDHRPPRLANGRPDLQGNWELTDPTPLVRPPGFTTLSITAEQARQIEQLVEARVEDRATPTEPTEYFTTRRVRPIRGEFRSSIIVEPENGQLPGRPELQRWLAKVPNDVLNAADGPEQRPASERCLGNPASQPPNLHNPGTNLHQILQTDDVVVFIAEWLNEARIIRLNSQHSPAAVTSWLGDSIGWWEGDTLAVETKYFTPSDPGRVAGGLNFRVSPDAVVRERFTRVSDVELNYVFTIDDPTLYTRQWKGETHFMRTNDRILEYACHEANDSLMYILRAARVREGAWPPSPEANGKTAAPVAGK